ncbi:hypothetical protein ACFQ9U_00180 [Streptomyces sp. NPDC056568]|uniref:hypothetical protein n=1 Tax=Streptomyces sp. NPDC056568 TaxID=3345866 RepID=UPI0036B08D83
MGCEAAGFGRDLGIDLVDGAAAKFEDGVFVVEFGKPFRQGQLMSVALMNPEGELPRLQLAGEHASCECSRDSLLAGFACDWIEGEAEFVKGWAKQVEDVIVRLGARTGGEDPKAGGVESGNKRIAGGIDNIARTNFPHTPEGGAVL